MEDKTTLFVVPAEAAMFLVFQQNYDTFSTLADAGTFSIRNGSATLHFDSAGVLQTIERRDYLYSRKHT